MSTVYRLIDEESQRWPVSQLCRALGVTRSGFYEWQRSPVSDRQISDWMLTEQIRAIFDESEQTYGSPRMFKELTLGRGLRIGEKRVARLMRQAGLVSVHAKKRKGCTTRAKEHPLAPDLVERDFNVDGPDRLWIADFTQLTTWQGTAYVAVIADAYSRLCLGWSVRSDKTVDLVLEALDMAIWRRGQMRASGAIHHSDQGSQLRRSLTWDQGAEMAEHAQLRIDAGIEIYFCDPHSPWQRGSNENTNGLLRQYFPRGTDLHRHSSEELAAVALALNSRPRKTLGWRTPAEALDDHLLTSAAS